MKLDYNLNVQYQYTMDWSDSWTEFVSIDVMTPKYGSSPSMIYGAGVMRDKDFNLLKRDYMVLFKIYSDVAGNTKRHIEECSEFNWVQAARMSLRYSAYYDPFTILYGKPESTAYSQTTEPYKSAYIYLKKYSDDDYSGGDAGVGLNSNLLGSGAIVVYGPKEPATTADEFFNNEQCDTGRNLLWRSY
jgi:hypothetical protein